MENNHRVVGVLPSWPQLFKIKAQWITLPLAHKLYGPIVSEKLFGGEGINHLPVNPFPLCRLFPIGHNLLQMACAPYASGLYHSNFQAAGRVRSHIHWVRRSQLITESCPLVLGTRAAYGFHCDFLEEQCVTLEACSCGRHHIWHSSWVL